MRGSEGVARPLVWVWLCEKDNSAFPRRFHQLTTKLTLNTPFSSTRRDALRPTYGPSYLRYRWCSASFDGGTASSLKAPIDSTPPQTPFLKGGFMASLPMFPLKVVQRLPTPPGDSYPTSRWNQNETRWPLSSTCTDVESAGSHWDSKHARRVRSWSSSQKGSSALALSEFLLPLDLLPFLPYLVFPFCSATKLPPPSSACPRSSNILIILSQFRFF